MVTITTFMDDKALLVIEEVLALEINPKVEMEVLVEEVLRAQ